MYESLRKEFENVPDGQGFGKKDIHPLKMVDEFSFRQMLVPNSYSAKICVAWMHDTFKKIGDHNPTRKEIHLDYGKKIGIYNMYQGTLRSFNIPETNIVSYNRFNEIWALIFPFVKTRKYKSVTGKCKFCSKLTELRQRTQKRESIVLITSYFGLHRHT
jgi:hypothetical protein